MYDHALKLNPNYAKTYCAKGMKFIFIFKELH